MVLHLKGDGMMAENALLRPVKIGNKTVPNRFAINAMEGTDADDRGNPSDLTYKRYERFFEGGSGFIDLEAITCQTECVSSPHQLVISQDNEKEITKFVKHLKDINSENVFVFQLTHAGELGNPNFSKALRVTEEPLPGFEHAEFVDEAAVDKIMDELVQGAVIAHNAGADGIDLKLCAGYLGSQILRPFNKHNWKYGGDWSHRKQFAIDLVDRIKDAVADENFIIGSKISLYEGFPGGQGTMDPESAVMDLTESIDLIKTLEEHGASYILTTCGAPMHTLHLVKPDKEDPYIAYLGQYFQKVCKDNLKPETVVIGGGYSIFSDGRQKNFNAVKPEKNTVFFWGNKLINDGVTDMVALGRQCLIDPYVPKKLAEGRENEIKWCTGCDNCSLLLISPEYTGCVTDPYYARLVPKALQFLGIK